VFLDLERVAHVGYLPHGVNINAQGRRGMHIGYWWEIQKERDHWEDQDVGGWTILKLILER
jgi:hypothetical protein